MKPHLYFHLAMWTTIAVVLLFSAPSEAAYFETTDSYAVTGATQEETAANWWSARYASDSYHCSYTIADIRLESGATYIVFLDYIYGSDCSDGPLTMHVRMTYRCDDGTNATAAEYEQGYCQGEDPPPPEIVDEGVSETCVGSGIQPQTVCMSGTRYSVGGVGVQVDSGWAATCTSTGQACTGEESEINPDYDLPVLPETDQSVSINGQSVPIVESGCGEVAGSLVCTNAPNCGEFNGQWVCTGPDSGTPGVPATPDYEYDLSGSVTADRAGDQYFYNSTTVSNSTNFGAGDSTDPAYDGKADPRNDGSDTGDSLDPLGQGSCPDGYVQSGLTANADGSTDVQCSPDGDRINWMEWADKFNMSDQLPDGWLDTPPIPGVSGPSSSCPAPQEFSFGGASVELPYDAFCDLAGMLRPLLILIGYMVAGWFIFRMVGGGK